MLKNFYAGSIGNILAKEEKDKYLLCIRIFLDVSSFYFFIFISNEIHLYVYVYIKKIYSWLNKQQLEKLARERNDKNILDYILYIERKFLSVSGMQNYFSTFFFSDRINIELEMIRIP